jgi:hypothetical protein
MKIFGPYPHKKRWRILIRLGSEQQARSFDTEAEAKAEIRKLRIEAHKQAGLAVEKAIEAYVEQLRRNGVRERSIDTTRYRLRKLFDPVLLVPLATVTPARARELFTKLEGSVDSRRNILNQARTFCRRSKENEWTDSILLADVKGEGKRHCGKQKLTVDESRKFLAACLDLAASANPKKQTEGVGAAMALVFGMRASEITSLQVRRPRRGRNHHPNHPCQEPSGDPIPSGSRVVSTAPTAACRGEGTHRTIGGSRPNLAPQKCAGHLPKGRNHRGTTARLAWNPRRPCALGGGDAALGEQGTRARITNHHVSTLRRRRNHPETRTREGG